MFFRAGSDVPAPPFFFPKEIPVGICRFKTSEVKRCIEHALGSSAWSMDYGDGRKPAPGIAFVHDNGVYLMSNGEPRDIAHGEMSYVAYAEGCNPTTDPDSWDESRYLVGGDDFVVTFTVTEAWLKECERFEELRVKVLKTCFKVNFAKPKRVKV